MYELWREFIKSDENNRICSDASCLLNKPSLFCCSQAGLCPGSGVTGLETALSPTVPAVGVCDGNYLGAMGA